MSGKYVYTHQNVRYYHLPIEAWRGLLDEPARVFNLCECIMCADCETNKELEEDYGFTCQNADSFKEQSRLGNCFLMGNKQSNVCFSISVEMYWQYKSDFLSDRIKEWDWLLLLWWMALHTVGGRTKIVDTNNEYVFCRAAGFATKADFKNHPFNGDEKILRYIANPARYASRIREELMLKYDSFHSYSQKGVRGWSFMIAMINRQAAFDMLAEHMAERGTKGQRKKELCQMMNAARKQAVNNK